jgi:hypothetical protein
MGCHSLKPSLKGTYTQRIEALLSGGSLVGVCLCAGPFICGGPPLCGGPGQLPLSPMPKSGPVTPMPISLRRSLLPEFEFCCSHVWKLSCSILTLSQQAALRGAAGNRRLPDKREGEATQGITMRVIKKQWEANEAKTICRGRKRGSVR